MPEKRTVPRIMVVKTEFKNAPTPLKVNLKQQLQRQQAQEQRQMSLLKNRQPPKPASMPLTISALTSQLPSKVIQVKTQLSNPTVYHVQQKRQQQATSYLTKTPTKPSPRSILNNNHRKKAASPDPENPSLLLGSDGNSYCSASEIDDLLGDLMQLEGVEPAPTDSEDDLTKVLHISTSTGPNKVELTLNGGGSTSSSPRSLLDELDDDTSAYLSESDIANWAKDRVKKDNHNQIERRRRFNINDRIKELGMMLPKTLDPDYRLNKGTILKASVEYIRALKKDQHRMRLMAEKMKQQERQNRQMMLRLQQCEMLLKQSGVQQASLLGQTLDPIAIKTEPEAMDDVPFAGDPMLSACTDIPDFNIDEAIMNMS